MNKKNIEIEHLRALAIIMTMMTHLPILLPHLNSLLMKVFSVFMPWSGVDLFFCISGFVVAKSYFSLLEKQSLNIGHWDLTQAFWIKRIYRLLPTAWTWAFIPLLLSIVLNNSGIFGTWYENVRSITAIITFTGNIANQYGMILGPNSVYWSLALEEQFYLLFPFFLFFVKTPSHRLTILALFILIQFPLDRNMFGTPTSAMLFSFRIDGFVWGILIYLFSQSQLFARFEPQFLENSKTAKLVFPLILVYLLGAIPGQMIAMPIAVGMIAIVSALLVFIASYNKGYLALPYPIEVISAWFGSRSYGIYVIHIPAYRVVRELVYRLEGAGHMITPQMLTLGSMAVAAILIGILAELNFRWIETPIRRTGIKIADARLKKISFAEKADAT